MVHRLSRKENGLFGGLQKFVLHCLVAGLVSRGFKGLWFTAVDLFAWVGPGLACRGCLNLLIGLGLFRKGFALQKKGRFFGSLIRGCSTGLWFTEKGLVVFFWLDSTGVWWPEKVWLR